MAQENETDALILSAVSGEWQKTALVISKVFDNTAFDKEKMSAQNVAEGIYALVDGGKLEATGNMRRWRDSNVRLVAVIPEVTDK